MTTEETCILRSLRPFLLVAKLLGIFGCRIYGERVERSGLFSHCYSIIWIIITYCLSATNFYDFISDDMQLTITRVAFFFTITSDMYNSIFQQRRIVAVFEKIHKFDQRVSNLGFPRKDATIIYWVMGMIPGSIFFCQQMETIFMENKFPSFLPILKYWYNPTMSYLVVMKFCMIVHMIYQRFKYLNEYVSRRIVDGNGMYNRQSITIYEIRYLHSKLREAAEQLIEIYSPWILVWCGVMMNVISRGMNKYIHRQGFSPTNYLIVIWMISLCVSCGITSDEANKIAQKLFENRPLSGDAADTMDRIEMALYLCNHQLRFTAMRMYSVNRSFLLAIMSMMVTYLTFTVAK